MYRCRVGAAAYHVGLRRLSHSLTSSIDALAGNAMLPPVISGVRTVNLRPMGIINWTNAKTSVRLAPGRTKTELYLPLRAYCDGCKGSIWEQQWFPKSVE